MDTKEKVERVKWRFAQGDNRTVLTVGPNTRFVVLCPSHELARQIVHEHNTWGELMEAAKESARWLNAYRGYGFDMNTQPPGWERLDKIICAALVAAEKERICES